MSKQHFDLSTRRAIWEAHSKRCAYCGEQLLFRNLEIDHIIPESSFNANLDSSTLLTSYGLDSTFDPYGPNNLLPACRSCNLRKSALTFSVGQVAIETARAKQKIPLITKLSDQFRRENTIDKARLTIASLVESERLSNQQIREIWPSLDVNNSPVDVFDLWAPADNLMEISAFEFDERLDLKIDLGDDMSNGLRLTNDNDEYVYVSNL